MYDHATRREDLAEQHLNIAMEKAIIEDLDVEKTSAPMILVIGQTGAGKSHFINRLVGKNIVKESARLFSCKVQHIGQSCATSDHHYQALRGHSSSRLL